MYKPRPAAWPGFPRSAGIDEYVPRDHLDRALTAAAATGISEEWTVPLSGYDHLDTMPTWLATAQDIEMRQRKDRIRRQEQERQRRATADQHTPQGMCSAERG